ncbi:MAG: hypothetical protein AAB664_04280 [Patescibacteria group bacterium]
MILLYRITPFLVAFTSALGFTALLLRWVHPFVIVGIALFLMMILFARLLQFQWSTFSFWFFLGTAAIFLLSTFSVLFLFEEMLTRVIVSSISVGFLMLFSEFVFLYVHLPSAYQPFSLEYLTLLMNLLSIFFFTCFGFAVSFLVQIPIFFLYIPFFFLSLFLIYGMLWVSKAESPHLRIFCFFWIDFIHGIFCGPFFSSNRFLYKRGFPHRFVLRLFWSHASASDS